jgi:hypothetical protein
MQVVIYAGPGCLDDPNGYHSRWTNQFIHADPAQPGVVLNRTHPGRLRFALPSHPNPNYRRRQRTPDHPSRSVLQELLRISETAARAAQGGEVIYLVGHGGFLDTDPNAGMIDLASNGHFRVQAATVFYNTGSSAGHVTIASQRTTDANILANPVFGAAERRAARDSILMRDTFDGLGEIFRRHHVSNVVFLTCQLGRAVGFLQRISQDWGVQVTAFSRRIAMDDRPDAGQYIRLYLNGDALGQGSNTERARTDYPSLGPRLDTPTRTVPTFNYRTGQVTQEPE